MLSEETRSKSFPTFKVTINEIPLEQYYVIYKNNIRLLTAPLFDKLKQLKSPKITKVAFLLEKKLSTVIGAIFKYMILKPCILDQFKPELADGPDSIVKEPKDNYVSETDILFLEDDSSKIEVASISDSRKLITGQVLAFIGVKIDGTFHVYYIILPGLPKQKYFKISSPLISRYLCLISGLSFGTLNCDLSLLEAFQNFIIKFKYFKKNKVQKKIIRLVIAGNSLSLSKVLLEDCEEILRAEVDIPEAENLRMLDFFLSDLSFYIPVDLMPGQEDPAMQFLPQQPMNNFMFPSSSNNLNFSLQTNPHHFEIDERTVFGTSGQSINNMKLYGDHSSISAMKLTLQTRNLSPNSPHSLGTFPFSEFNPLIITELPHVYFAGNQEEFIKCYVSGIDQKKSLLLSIPVFSRKKVIVLVNIDTIQCKIKTFV